MINEFEKISSNLKILGIGTDICSSQRITHIYEAFGKKFIDKICHATEQDIANNYSLLSQKIAYLAKRFAAKEACAKALGTGIGGQAFLKEIVCTKDSRNVPQLTLYGKTHQTALMIAHNKGFKEYEAFLSLSDEKDYALAFVILAGK